jgi:hypothetical protein
MVYMVILWADYFPDNARRRRYIKDGCALRTQTG